MYSMAKLMTDKHGNEEPLLDLTAQRFEESRKSEWATVLCVVI
jgi:hypothetical protein